MSSFGFDPSTDLPTNMGKTLRRGPDLQVNMDATPWGRPTIREFKTLVGKLKEFVNVDEILHERGVNGDYSLLAIDAWNTRGNKDMREMKDHSSRVPRSIKLPLIRPGEEEVKWKPRDLHSTNVEDRGPNAFDAIQARVSDGVKLGGMPHTLIDSPSGPNTRLVQTDLLGLKLIAQPTYTISAQTGVASKIFQTNIHSLKVGGRQTTTTELTSGQSLQPVQSISVKMTNSPNDYTVSSVNGLNTRLLQGVSGKTVAENTYTVTGEHGLNNRPVQGVSGKTVAGNHFTYVSEQGQNTYQPQTSLQGARLVNSTPITLSRESGIKTLTQTIMKDVARLVSRVTSTVDSPSAPNNRDSSNMAKLEKVKAELQYTESQMWDTRDSSDHGLNSKPAALKTIVDKNRVENSQSSAPLRGGGFANFIAPRLKRDM